MEKVSQNLYLRRRTCITHKIGQLTTFLYRRFAILLKTHLLTYKDDSGDYRAPTEIIPINNCCTVKSADDELNLKNTFVSIQIMIVIVIEKPNSILFF